MKQYEQCKVIITTLEDKDVLVSSVEDNRLFEDDFFTVQGGMI